jgi:KDO2-lipid IV(A) lauroyltransferase
MPGQTPTPDAERRTPNLLDRVADLLARSVRMIPPSLARRFGGWCGEVFAGLPFREPARCREHLARAFPERDAAWVARTARACFRHAGRMALWTVATLHRPARELRRGVAVEGVEGFRAMVRAGQRGEGTVGFTGHFGNWELLSRLGATFAPLTVVGRRLRSPLADRLVRGARTASGARQVYQDADLREFVRELRAGRLLATLADQDIPRLAGVFVPWFGIPAYTPSGPAALALLTGAAVQPAFLYERRGRWVLHVGPRRRFARSGDTEADLLAITTWVMAYEESLVRRAPHQWVWWHQRWRTTPADAERAREKERGRRTGKIRPEVRKSGSPEVH